LCPQVRTLIAEYDTNKDGKIDYDEFLIMMRSQNAGLKQASSFLRTGLRADKTLSAVTSAV
jgi:EF hand